MSNNELFDQIEFEPLSRIALPVEAFSRAGLRFDHGTDDLDDYVYAVLQADDGRLFAIVHYREQPSEMTDLFVPKGSVGTAPHQVGEFVARLARELEIEPTYFSFRTSLEEPFVAEIADGKPRTDRGGPPIMPVPVIH